MAAPQDSKMEISRGAQGLLLSGKKSQVGLGSGLLGVGVLLKDRMGVREIVQPGGYLTCC